MMLVNWEQRKKGKDMCRCVKTFDMTLNQNPEFVSPQNLGVGNYPGIHDQPKGLESDLSRIIVPKDQYGSVKPKMLISDVKFKRFYSFSSTSVFWLFRTKL